MALTVVCLGIFAMKFIPTHRLIKSTPTLTAEVLWPVYVMHNTFSIRKKVEICTRLTPIKENMLIIWAVRDNRLDALHTPPRNEASVDFFFLREIRDLGSDLFDRTFGYIVP